MKQKIVPAEAIVRSAEFAVREERQAYALRTLGLALLRAGEFEKAAASFREALQDTPWGDANNKPVRPAGKIIPGEKSSYAAVEHQRRRLLGVVQNRFVGMENPRVF